MPLSDAERRELEELERTLGGAPAPQPTQQAEQPLAMSQASPMQTPQASGSGLSREEEQELANLEATLGRSEADPGASLERSMGRSVADPESREVNRDVEFARYGDSAFPIRQEMHSDISPLHRAIVKNLSNDTPTSVNYLQKQYPNHQIIVEKGQILMKRPEEQEFRALDPKGFDWQDIPDLGWTVGQALGETAAMAAGGVKGAVLGGGIGAIPGAMAGGALAGSGFEALRQKLGQWAGLPQEVEGGDVAVSGAIGAASPLLLGSGAGAKAVAKGAKASGKAFGKEALKSLQDAQRGVISRGYRSIAPRVGNTLATTGETVSGVPRDLLKTQYQHGSEIAGMLPGDDLKRATSVFRGLKGNITEGRIAVGQELEALQKSVGNVDISSARSQIDSRIQELARSDRLSDREAARALKRIQTHAFAAGRKGTGKARKTVMLPDEVKAETALSLRGELKALARMQGTGERIGSRHGKNVTVEDAMGKEAFRKAYKEIDNIMENVAPGIREKAEKYASFKDLERRLETPFGSPEKTLRSLQTMDRPSRDATRMLLEESNQLLGGQGAAILDEARKMQAANIFRNATFLPRSGQATTSTSRSGALGLGGYLAGSELTGDYKGGLAGAALASSMGSPGALKFYMRQLGRADKAAKAGIQGMDRQILNGTATGAAAGNFGVSSGWDLLQRGE